MSVSSRTGAVLRGGQGAGTRASDSAGRMAAVPGNEAGGGPGRLTCLDRDSGDAGPPRVYTRWPAPDEAGVTALRAHVNAPTLPDNRLAHRPPIVLASGPGGQPGSVPSAPREMRDSRPRTMRGGLDHGPSAEPTTVHQRRLVPQEVMMKLGLSVGYSGAQLHLPVERVLQDPGSRREGRGAPAGGSRAASSRRRRSPC